MTDQKILEIATFLSHTSIGSSVLNNDLIKKFNLNDGYGLPNIAQINKALAKISNKQVQQGKKNSLRIIVNPNSKIKSPLSNNYTELNNEKPLFTGPKTGNEAAGKYLAHHLFGYTEKPCTTTMAFNQLKMNDFINFDFHQALKYANNILKKEYKLKLELINGYLVPKKIEEIQKKKIELTNLKKIEPLIQINGQKYDIKTFKLFVYDSINNLICTNGQHHKTENITMITNNCLGKQVKFNVFHCLYCNKYYTTSQTVDSVK